MKTYVTIHALARYGNKYLILQRAKQRSDPNTWNCITGFIQDHESVEEGALRELKEETNLEGKIIKTSDPLWKDFGDIRWIVIPSLIEIEDVSNLKIDTNESQAYKWIDADDEIINTSQGLKETISKLLF